MEKAVPTPAATSETAPSSAEGATKRDLGVPSSAQMLEAVLRLGREIHLEMEEEAIAGQFVALLSELFPERLVSIRVLNPRTSEPARVYANTTVRAGVETERLTFKASSIEKTRLKDAIANSARLRVGDRWDSPFTGVADGFVVPLVASGELYGCLDVGYPLEGNAAAADEPIMLPIANHLSVALRNERLHREASVLRDYQAKLIEHANALILGVDRHWRITVCNRALLELTGFTREDVIGRDLRDWIPAGDRHRMTNLFLTAMVAGGQSESVDVALSTSDGGFVRTVWSVAAISGRRKVEAIVAIGQDQTRLRELQGQVIHAEKLATLGQLAAGVVHELNNPLTSITVYAEFLLRKAERAFEELEPDRRPESGDIEKLRRIRTSAQRILQFARDLVQYAKPAGDEVDVVSINQVVRQSLSFCEHLFSRADVVLEQELDEELPSVYAISGQLEQVVINLVTNAVQALSAGGWVAVRTTRVGDRVALLVSDSGTGIAPEDRVRVFDPFFTTKIGGNGTGLGLSIVKNIIEQHKGEISVDAAEGGGAVFRILLPPVG